MFWLGKRAVLLKATYLRCSDIRQPFPGKSGFHIREARVGGEVQSRTGQPSLPRKIFFSFIRRQGNSSKAHKRCSFDERGFPWNNCKVQKNSSTWRIAKIAYNSPDVSKILKCQNNVKTMELCAFFFVFFLWMQACSHKLQLSLMEAMHLQNTHGAYCLNRINDNFLANKK